MSRESVPSPSIPVPSREDLIDTVAVHSCLNNCMGKKGLAAGCCTMGTRDYIIGPVHDTGELLERLSKHFGREVSYEEFFIDYEEGSKMFPDRPSWQRRDTFPALRVDQDDEALPCIFLAEDNLCSIHEIRSTTCRNYQCDHLKALIAAL